MPQSFTGLSPVTTYYARVKARNQDLTETAYTALGSTRTSFNISVPIPQAVSVLGVSSVTAQWSDPGNPAGTSYEAQISPDNFTSVTASATALTQGTFTGLSVSTSYALRVRALLEGKVSNWVTLASSSATLANAPSAPSEPFSLMESSSFTLTWGSNSNPVGTSYYAELSVNSNFSPITSISFPFT